jgi:hypothetical protein
MESLCFGGRQALAKFFNALLLSKAHWYRILAPSSDEPQHVLIRSNFPPLSDFFSLSDYSTAELFVQLGLAWHKKGNHSPLLKAWESFIAKFKLPAEITTFSTKAKQHLYIRLGTWKEKAHPQANPVEIWKQACLSGSYPLPKLQISSLSMRFASDITELGFHVLEHLDSESECEVDSKSECEDDSKESRSVSEPEKEESGGENESSSEDENDGKAVNLVSNASSDLCPNQFPLLHKLGVHSNFMDKLLQELVKYNGRHSIEYVQGNSHPGYLVPQPSFCSEEKCKDAITAKTTLFMDNIVSNISKSASCTISEAAEC